jgi:hypothetical protein
MDASKQRPKDISWSSTRVNSEIRHKVLHSSTEEEQPKIHICIPILLFPEQQLPRPSEPKQLTHSEPASCG